MPRININKQTIKSLHTQIKINPFFGALVSVCSTGCVLYWLQSTFHYETDRNQEKAQKLVLEKREAEEFNLVHKTILPSLRTEDLKHIGQQYNIPAEDLTPEIAAKLKVREELNFLDRKNQAYQEIIANKMTKERHDMLIKLQKINEITPKLPE